MKVKLSQFWQTTFFEENTLAHVRHYLCPLTVICLHVYLQELSIFIKHNWRQYSILIQLKNANCWWAESTLMPLHHALTHFTFKLRAAFLPDPCLFPISKLLSTPGAMHIQFWFTNSKSLWVLEQGGGVVSSPPHSLISPPFADSSVVSTKNHFQLFMPIFPQIPWRWN